MHYRFRSAFCILGLLFGSICLAQNYRCDWSVNGIGGGDMAGAYKCGSTVGQTAAGPINGTDYWALIGFWQPEGQVGVREQVYLPSAGPLVTQLYSPFPTPFVRSVAVRYSLATEGRVELLADGVLRPGRYSVNWRGTDDRGRDLARGVYFCRLKAGDYVGAEKLVLRR
jgi:hypothetical protein